MREARKENSLFAQEIMQNSGCAVTAMGLMHMKMEEDLECMPLLFRPGEVNQWKDSLEELFWVWAYGAKVEAKLVIQQEISLAKKDCW